MCERSELRAAEPLEGVLDRERELGALLEGAEAFRDVDAEDVGLECDAVPEASASLDEISTSQSRRRRDPSPRNIHVGAVASPRPVSVDTRVGAAASPRSLWNTHVTSQVPRPPRHEARPGPEGAAPRGRPRRARLRHFSPGGRALGGNQTSRRLQDALCATWSWQRYPDPQWLVTAQVAHSINQFPRLLRVARNVPANRTTLLARRPRGDGRRVAATHVGIP